MTIRDLPKKQRHEAILKEARTMAESGNYSDFMEIEIALRGDGLSEARHLLDNRFIRRELNEACAEAQKRKSVNK